jgi:hypothetical protein
MPETFGAHNNNNNNNNSVLREWHARHCKHTLLLTSFRRPGPYTYGGD